eukprot:CAMPEP_0181345570 /NCGR_PEP_ID=MMETSP1101-20121128/32822_1 /TAXON_ID=46948 /ORGANISM="Rhodomonas abbreviata, Strain Caron Lab Isolate" /LENGTH=229 /DNA_ID=CAMNT_0023457539 /DNA_START=117 /DNA_END=803 /DNA_ORIENTATION=+
MQPSVAFQAAGLSQVVPAGIRFNAGMRFTPGTRLRGGGHPALSSLRAEGGQLTGEEAKIFEVIKTPIEEVLGTSAERFNNVMQSLSEEGKLGAWNIANLRLRPKDAPDKQAYKEHFSTTPHETVAQGVSQSNGGTPAEWEERRVLHEAAHLLVGYICGFAVQKYEVEGVPRCVFHEPVALQGKLTVDQMNQYAVLLLAGIQAERNKYTHVDKEMGMSKLGQLEAMYERG